ncbi:sulfatase-like hydrolase/transferase [Haloarcula marina]|uniref:sulfatase-like hydrolase/transferase n=1 Tax=Haloarcula marina TaxID=2961574 RepID=UPI0020B85668|nr:sulfatase-like hydrolase/transferase [Halomicroarcula marina]
MLGQCGDGFVETPNVDALAEDGVRFDQTYCTAPVCGPSRTGLYTGRYPHEVGGWTNGIGIEAGIETAGEYFREAGYRTAYVGKWHLDGEYFGTGEAPPGYESEYWYDWTNYREDIGEEAWEWYRSGIENQTAEHDIEEIHDRGITREDTWAGNITERTLAFLENAADDDRPYFLAANYDEPHEPSTCPPPYCDRYRDEPYPLPDNYKTVEDLRRHGRPRRQQEYAAAYASGNAFLNSLENAEEEGEIYRPLYFGCVEFVDAEMGRIFDAVDFEETVAAFTSDHGHYLGAHGLDLKHFAMYDEVTNVPMVMRGPSLSARCNLPTRPQWYPSSSNIFETNVAPSPHSSFPFIQPWMLLG